MDLISSKLNQIMNAKKVGKEEVIVIPISKLFIDILKIMKKGGYIDFKIEKDKFDKAIIKILKLNECKAIKPRFYVKKQKYDKFIKRFLPARDFGILIISTNKGLLTHKEAIEKGVGGSLIAYCF